MDERTISRFVTECGVTESVARSQLTRYNGNFVLAKAKFAAGSGVSNSTKSVNEPKSVTAVADNVINNKPKTLTTFSFRVTLHDDGFCVDDGALRSYNDDVANSEFLEALVERRMPNEIKLVRLCFDLAKINHRRKTQFNIRRKIQFQYSVAPAQPQLSRFAMKGVERRQRLALRSDQNYQANQPLTSQATTTTTTTTLIIMIVIIITTTTITRQRRFKCV